MAAERLGFKAGEIKPDARSLAEAPTPFLVVGRRPGEGWLVRRRVADHLLLQDPAPARERAPRRTVADLARRVVLLKALPEPAQPGHWRQSIMRRLRPVLWELGLASVVINLLALATPIFLMTVYNKVINHGALQTLDVLVLGMITLFVFEWLLRLLRAYIASHTGGRLDAALGSEVVHHLVHMPLKSFEAVPTGQIVERTRQLDHLRQFFTSQMPLLLVDLAFVGVFVAVLFYLDVRLGAITLAAMPLFWLLSMIARGLHKRLVEAASRPRRPRPRASARRSARRSRSRRSASSRHGAALQAEARRSRLDQLPVSNLGGVIASSARRCSTWSRW